MMTNRQVLTKTEDFDEEYGVNTVNDEVLQEIQRKLGGFSAPSASETYPESTVTEDATPSASTMSMSFKRNYAEDEMTFAKKRLSTNTKIAIAGYVAVVLLLVLAVSLCSVAISRSFASLTANQAAYAEAMTNYEALEEQVTAENYEELYQKAVSMGYVEVSGGSSYTYTELATREARNLHVQTNWFDQLCEWVSSIFGG